MAMEVNIGYKGNSLVKKAGIVHEFTKEQVEEYIKCSNDPIYFIRNYCKIISAKGLQLFDPYTYQIRMVEAFNDHNFIINLLPRQMGKSTIVAAYILHYAIFTPEKTIGILANKEKLAKEVFSRIRRMYENLPLWLQPGVKEWNKSQMELGNDTIIASFATSSSSARGFSFNMIYLDEFAHVEQQEDFWESTYPVISADENAKVIITSTPKGLELFYKIYSEAESGENDFYPIRVHWSEHPTRDEGWKEKTLRNIGHQKFMQEFECEFQGSSGTLIAGAKLQTLVYKKPIKDLKQLLIYEDPKKDHNYATIVDVSRGKGLDYSAFQIIDVTSMPYIQVATYRDNTISPAEYVDVIYRVCKSYNDSAVLVEVNDIGEQVSEMLYFDLEYENVLFTESAGRSGKKISTGFGGKNKDKGIRTTTSVKSIGCSILKLLIEQDQLIINDFETIKELSTFSKKGNSFEAESGKNDDLVMGLVLFAWLSDQKYFKEFTDINTLARLREKTEDEIMEELSSFGFFTDGIDDVTEEQHTNGNMWASYFQS